MSHTCHWPNCGKTVPPKLWGCKTHWFLLPPILRSHVWKHYRPGQEEDKKPSPEYLAVVTIIQSWILDYENGDTSQWDALFARSRRTGKDIKTDEIKKSGDDENTH